MQISDLTDKIHCNWDSIRAFGLDAHYQTRDTKNNYKRTKKNIAKIEDDIKRWKEERSALLVKELVTVSTENDRGRDRDYDHGNDDDSAGDDIKTSISISNSEQVEKNKDGCIIDTDNIGYTKDDFDYIINKLETKLDQMKKVLQDCMKKLNHKERELDTFAFYKLLPYLDNVSTIIFFIPLKWFQFYTVLYKQTMLETKFNNDTKFYKIYNDFINNEFIQIQKIYQYETYLRKKREEKEKKKRFNRKKKHKFKNGMSMTHRTQVECKCNQETDQKIKHGYNYDDDDNEDVFLPMAGFNRSPSEKTGLKKKIVGNINHEYVGNMNDKQIKSRQTRNYNAIQSFWQKIKVNHDKNELNLRNLKRCKEWINLYNSIVLYDIIKKEKIEILNQIIKENREKLKQKKQEKYKNNNSDNNSSDNNSGNKKSCCINFECLSNVWQSVMYSCSQCCNQDHCCGVQVSNMYANNNDMPDYISNNQETKFEQGCQKDIYIIPQNYNFKSWDWFDEISQNLNYKPKKEKEKEKNKKNRNRKLYDRHKEEDNIANNDNDDNDEDDETNNKNRRFANMLPMSARYSMSKRDILLQRDRFGYPYKSETLHSDWQIIFDECKLILYENCKYKYNSKLMKDMIKNDQLMYQLTNIFQNCNVNISNYNYNSNYNYIHNGEESQLNFVGLIETTYDPIYDRMPILFPQASLNKIENNISYIYYYCRKRELSYWFNSNSGDKSIKKRVNRNFKLNLCCDCNCMNNIANDDDGCYDCDRDVDNRMFEFFNGSDDEIVDANENNRIVLSDVYYLKKKYDIDGFSALKLNQLVEKMQTMAKNVLNKNKKTHSQDDKYFINSYSNFYYNFCDEYLLSLNNQLRKEVSWINQSCLAFFCFENYITSEIVTKPRSTTMHNNNNESANNSSDDNEEEEKRNNNTNNHNNNTNSNDDAQNYSKLMSSSTIIVTSGDNESKEESKSASAEIILDDDDDTGRKKNNSGSRSINRKNMKNTINYNPIMQSDNVDNSDNNTENTENTENGESENDEMKVNIDYLEYLFESNEIEKDLNIYLYNIELMKNRFHKLQSKFWDLNTDAAYQDHSKIKHKLLNSHKLGLTNAQVNELDLKERKFLWLRLASYDVKNQYYCLWFDTLLERRFKNTNAKVTSNKNNILKYRQDRINRYMSCLHKFKIDTLIMMAAIKHELIIYHILKDCNDNNNDNNNNNNNIVDSDYENEIKMNKENDSEKEDENVIEMESDQENKSDSVNIGTNRNDIDVFKSKKTRDFTIYVSWNLGIVFELCKVSKNRILPKIIKVNNVNSWKHGIRKNMYIVSVNYKSLENKNSKEIRKIFTIFDTNEKTVIPCTFKKIVS